jgi:hypothetical protein
MTTSGTTSATVTVTASDPDASVNSTLTVTFSFSAVPTIMKDIDDSGNEVGDAGAEWRLNDNNTPSSHQEGDLCYQYFTSSTATNPVFGGTDINQYCSIVYREGTWFADFDNSQAFGGTSTRSQWRIIDSSVGTNVKEVQYYWQSSWNRIGGGFSRFRNVM